MSYLPHTASDRRAMLETIGVERMEDLFDDVPEPLLFPDLDLPPPTSELEVERSLTALAASDRSVAHRPCFLGAGVYRHWIPPTVDTVLRRGELFTAYTPYQAEASQGMLQATFEFQSLVCQLTGMEVSNASHYDGATALAEAALLALGLARGKRDRLLIGSGVHPRSRAVLRTYLQGTDHQGRSATLEGDQEPGVELAELVERVDERTAALIVQSPNFFGQLEPLEGCAERVHEAGALLIVVPDPIALGMLRPPGELGADIVAAEGQALGIPLAFGGPHLGLFATRRELMRRTVGRLVGEAHDAAGRRGYVLTLTTREQHIRRARATSNICTNSALMALAAAVYLATLGKEGLRRVAELCWHKSHWAAAQLAELPGCRVNPQAPERPFFKELVLELPMPAARANRHLREEYDMVGGYDLGEVDPALEHRLLLAFTETCSRSDIERLIEGLRAAITKEGT